MYVGICRKNSQCEFLDWPRLYAYLNKVVSGKSKTHFIAGPRRYMECFHFTLYSLKNGTRKTPSNYSHCIIEVTIFSMSIIEISRGSHCLDTSLPLSAS